MRTKPNSENYRLCAVELGVPFECMLATEDSPTGARLRAESSLDDRWVVAPPSVLPDTVDTLLNGAANPSGA